jgi:hypothetical protein
MTPEEIYADLQSTVPAQRSTLGTVATKIAEFDRNTCETIRVDLAPCAEDWRGGLVQIASWGAPKNGRREVYGETIFECCAGHLPNLIAALQAAHERATRPFSEPRREKVT